MAKQRLDELLVKRGLADDQKQAQALILAGRVTSKEQRLDKSGLLVASDTEIEVKGVPRYVSRAGEKLASVSETLGLDFSGQTILDVGASTGGFTDYVLQHGATKVYAVDVGRGQLAWRLLHDPRVISLERSDIREVELPEMADQALIDASFVSLTKILEAVAERVKSGGLIVALAKPQFEAGKVLADRFHGVISDEGIRQQLLSNLRDWIEERFEILGEADSGLAGADGNIERFFKLRAKR